NGLWIFADRQKTSVQSKIPLLPKAIEILQRYKDDIKCIAENRVLPVLTNQKYNAYLKEIADLCGINKNLTTHCARHTFSTTITLANGVPIETKCIGYF
ncbi:MAG TPA: tyrosine-type recombinase/integrase, partial [Ferruginibacter sp.]|nr:tyrosine-type recombinase/integrase [Ferruginibacter sp.]